MKSLPIELQPYIVRLMQKIVGAHTMEYFGALEYYKNDKIVDKLFYSV